MGVMIPFAHIFMGVIATLTDDFLFLRIGGGFRSNR